MHLMTGCSGLLPFPSFSITQGQAFEGKELPVAVCRYKLEVWRVGFSFLLKCKAFMLKAGTKNLMPNVASFSFSRCCCPLPVDSRYTCPGFSSLKADSWMSSFTVTYVSMSEIRRMGGQAEISREELRCHEKSV